MRMLILTLSTGEAALPTLREQIRRQTFQADHHVIEGLPNRAAHAALHDVVMRRAGEYELFFKIDADMTFRRDTALQDVVAGIARYPDVRHFLFPLQDFFTEQEIRGVSLYRSGVRWALDLDGLFVDPAPIDAKATWCGGSATPFLNHGEIASDFECFSFGVHKMIKVLQRDRSDKQLSKQTGRLLDLRRVRRLCRAPDAARHWLAMRGAAWVLRNRDYASMESKAELQLQFEKIRAGDAALDALARRLVASDAFWYRALALELGWLTAVRAVVERPPAAKKRTVFIDTPPP